MTVYSIDDVLDIAAGLLLTCGVAWVFLVSWPTERPEGEQ